MSILLDSEAAWNEYRDRCDRDFRAGDSGCTHTRHVNEPALYPCLVRSSEWSPPEDSFTPTQADYRHDFIYPSELEEMVETMAEYKKDAQSTAPVKRQ